MKKRFISYFTSPIGVVEISGTKGYITSVNFVMEEGEETEGLPEIILRCKKELEEYFTGKRRRFSVATRPDGRIFQKTVWKLLKKIKYGETKSYGEIAKYLKLDNGSRAVGHANAKNPLAIIIPCHRVISQDGKLSGYSGGKWRKQWLLDMEGNISGKNPTLF